MQADWLFRGDGSICNFRSAGVLIRNNRVLMQRDRDALEYALPGGHVKVGESSVDSLIREYREETGADIICERLIWIEECFWRWNDKPAHTLAFYYRIHLRGDTDIPDDGALLSQKDNCDVILEWVSLDALQPLTVYPSFLKERIWDIGDRTEHFITRQ